MKKIAHRNYFVLLCLILLFLAPGLSAYLYFKHPNWLSAASTNKGVFLNPPILIANLNTPPKGIEKQRWHLVLWSPEPCDTICMEQLDKLARIRLALGRRLYEVSCHLILEANLPKLSKKWQNLLHTQDIKMVRLTEDTSPSSLPKQLKIFIANSEGYLILAYEPTTKPDDIFYDMKHLLTIDQTSK